MIPQKRQTSLLFYLQAELEKMLATVKLLQSKNASTGTISMSKRLMAINEAFSANLGTGPILSLPNGSARPLPAPATKPNLCVTASTALSVTSCSSASNGSTSHGKLPGADIAPLVLVNLTLSLHYT